MKICLVTGATSGVGKALAHRLLEEHPKNEPITLCLTYRSSAKMDQVKRELLSAHPKVTIDTVKVDLAYPKTAVTAAREIKSKYNHIDHIFFNAGIMPVDSINWSIFLSMSLSKLCLLGTSGVGLVNQADETTSDGLQLTFTTNVTSHYIMLKELQPLLEEQEETCHVIWSSSRTSIHGAIDPNDIQNRKCIHPYYTSKQAMDLLSVELNKRLNSKGIYSDVTCPGMNLSQLTYAILPKLLWWFLVPIFMMLRIVSGLYVLFPWNGAEAHIWLSKQNPSAIDHTFKYCSQVDALCRLSTNKQPLTLSDELTRNVMRELEDIAQRFT